MCFSSQGPHGNCFPDEYNLTRKAMPGQGITVIIITLNYLR